MYKFKKITKVQHVELLFKLLIISLGLVFLVPMLLGISHKYFQLMDVQMIIWTSSLSITLGVLGYLITIFTIFNLLYWGD